MTHTRAAAAVAVCAMLAAGCTDSSAEPTLPPGTPAPTTATPTPTAAATSTPTPRPAAPTAADVQQLVVDYRNILLELPPIEQDQVFDTVTTPLAQITTPDGPARDAVLAVADSLTTSDTPRVLRGTARIEDVTPPDRVAVDVWEATACVADEAFLTPLDNPEPGDGDVPIVGAYTEARVAVVPNDTADGWLLRDYDQPTDEDLRQPCVPDALTNAIADSWDEMISLNEEWGKSGQTSEGLQPLEKYWTGGLLDRARGNVDRFTNRQSRDVYYDLQVASASPALVITEWCEDPSLDPDGLIVDNESGREIDLSDNPPALHRAHWIHEQDMWRVNRWDTSVKGAQGAPEEHRCF